MEVYLNSIEMGNGIYGVDAVAEYHFNKKASDLFRSECALIAATLPNPRKFDSQNPSAYMKKRQRQIEHEMRLCLLSQKKVRILTLLLQWVVIRVNSYNI